MGKLQIRGGSGEVPQLDPREPYFDGEKLFIGNLEGNGNKEIGGSDVTISLPAASAIAANSPVVINDEGKLEQVKYDGSIVKIGDVYTIDKPFNVSDYDYCIFSKYASNDLWVCYFDGTTIKIGELLFTGSAITFNDVFDTQLQAKTSWSYVRAVTYDPDTVVIVYTDIDGHGTVVSINTTDKIAGVPVAFTAQYSDYYSVAQDSGVIVVASITGSSLQIFTVESENLITTANSSITIETEAAVDPVIDMINTDQVIVTYMFSVSGCRARVVDLTTENVGSSIDIVGISMNRALKLALSENSSTAIVTTLEGDNTRITKLNIDGLSITQEATIIFPSSGFNFIVDFFGYEFFILHYTSTGNKVVSITENFEIGNVAAIDGAFNARDHVVYFYEGENIYLIASSINDFNLFTLSHSNFDLSKLIGLSKSEALLTDDVVEIELLGNVWSGLSDLYPGLTYGVTVDGDLNPSQTNVIGRALSSTILETKKTF